MSFTYIIPIPESTTKLKLYHTTLSMPFKTEVMILVNFYSADYICITKSSQKHLYPVSLDLPINESLPAYVQIFVQNALGENLPGLMNILFYSGEAIFGFEMAAVSFNANLASKPGAQTQILKNNIICGQNFNSEIMIVNVNPSLSEKNSRSGLISWDIYDEDGKSVSSGQRELKSGHLFFLDVHSQIKFLQSDRLNHFVFTSTQDFAVLPLTFCKIEDHYTGCEHSQPKFAYFRSGTQNPQARKINVLRKWLSSFY